MSITKYKKKKENLLQLMRYRKNLISQNYNEMN